MPKDIVVSDKVEINAPASKVWEVLTDLDSYPDWNPFTVKIKSELQLGKKVDLYLPKRNGSGELFKQTEYLEAYEPHNKLAWGMKLLAPWILKARRDQYVVPIDDQRCTYYTTDAFKGLFTGLIMKSHGAWIEKGFNSVAHALKARVESLVAQEATNENTLETSATS